MNELISNEKLIKICLFFLVKTIAIYDCLDSSTISDYKRAIAGIKTIIDIKPTVIQDFNTIFEKFPCNEITSMGLNVFVSRKNLLAPMIRHV